MNETVLKIAMAAFMHDIGKFANRDVLGVTEDFINNNIDLYQPNYQGRYSHRHALYTAAFIERLQKILPAPLNSPVWGDGDAFINLAGCHHKPETPMQWTVAVADRLSAGWDRDESRGREQEYSQKDYRRTRLYPLFEQLRTTVASESATEQSFGYCYPLEPISPSSIFPTPIERGIPSSTESAMAEYERIFKGFCGALDRLLHKDENVQLWFEHFDSLMMTWTSAIPAARWGNVVPDVSLYDHSRSTAALATALYLYHVETATLTVENIKSPEPPKFLIVTGDFYGIQKFLFACSGDTRKHRSKLLRGRSLQVSLFSELVADMVCREVGVPFSSVVLNAAGKFTAILPNTPRVVKLVSEIEEQANDWLLNMSLGENALGLSVREASPADFIEGSFSVLWDRLQSDAEKKKYSRIDANRYCGPVTTYLDAFNNDLSHPLCPLCGKRPSATEAEDSSYLGDTGSACKICRDHVFMGTSLPKKSRIAILGAKELPIKRESCLLEPIFHRYQVAFFQEEALDDLAKNGRLLRYWQVSTDAEADLSPGLTVKLIGGYVPQLNESDRSDDRIALVEEREGTDHHLPDRIRAGEPKTFGHIAAKSLNVHAHGDRMTGLEALGILKADVDNLGLLLSCGLSEERYTISRLATLSRQFHLYFSLYIPHLLRTDPLFRDVYTVFAGGDDLFLIGPWNRILGLARVLHGSFANYVCNNGGITFSAGISVEKPHRPVDKMAEQAESALAESKSLGRALLSVFGVTSTWEEVERLSGIKEAMWQWLADGWINKAMLYRLNHLIRMAMTEEQVVRCDEIDLRDMDCTKWRSLLAYSVERNAAKNLKGDDRTKAVKQISAATAEWLTEFRGKLRIPLWEVLYDIR